MGNKEILYTVLFVRFPDSEITAEAGGKAETFPAPSYLKENHGICFILIFKADSDSGLLWRNSAVLLINALKSGHISKRKEKMHSCYVTFWSNTFVFLLFLGIFC